MARWSYSKLRSATHMCRSFFEKKASCAETNGRPTGRDTNMDAVKAKQGDKRNTGKGWIIQQLERQGIRTERIH